MKAIMYLIGITLAGVAGYVLCYYHVFEQVVQWLYALVH